MRLDQHTREFLCGDHFSNSSSFAVELSPMRLRNQLLGDLAEGRRVLHVGCADHVPLIAEKRRQGTYLHDVLVASAQSVIGLDTDESALEYMRQIGIRDLYAPATLPADADFDLVVAADVIEHVPDVGQFVRELAGYGAEVVVSTPNAFRLANRLRFRAELINTDHRYWFSPYSLSKCLTEEGFEVQRIDYVDGFAKRRPVSSMLKLMFPLLRDGLVATARPTVLESGTRDPQHGDDSAMARRE